MSKIIFWMNRASAMVAGTNLSSGIPCSLATVLYQITGLSIQGF
ncbi:MAG: hypothetical protein ACYDG2_02415 [Ruminiclostridium sp.]